MMELYITIVYTMMAQVAQKHCMRKKLVIIKTSHKGEVKFSVMSLKEPQEVNSKGLKLALENSILKLGFNIERKNRGIFVSFLY